MANFSAQTATDLLGLDLFSGFSKISTSTENATPSAFRIRLSATETVEVQGNFILSGGGVPTSGTVTSIQLSVANAPVQKLDGISVLLATAIGYSASQAAALAAWPVLLAGTDTVVGSSFSDRLTGLAGADVWTCPGFVER